MVHYIHVAGDGTGLGTWEVTDTRVRRTDGARIDYPRSAGVDILKNIESTAPFSKVHELKLAPGEYHPRIARPSSSYPNDSPGYNPDNIKNTNLIAESLGQLSALKEQLERVCRAVHPAPSNFSTFGHEIRNLLILASTEVETQWKGVLAANGVRAENTQDYIRLSPALRLPNYRIAFPFYPWLPPLQPFQNWLPGSRTPTKDLCWYDAYNAVKHDREREFSRATLEMALSAVAAHVVMLCAQFGWNFPFQTRIDLRSYFSLASVPVWDPSEAYTPLREGDKRDFTTSLEFRF